MGKISKKRQEEIKELNCPSTGQELGAITEVGPFDAWSASGQADESTELADSLSFSTEEKKDAFRHCHWSCEMTKSIGAEQAKSVGDMHEACVPNTPNDTAMDLHNNEAGRRLAELFDSCQAACKEGLTNGTLQIKP